MTDFLIFGNSRDLEKFAPACTVLVLRDLEKFVPAYTVMVLRDLEKFVPAYSNGASGLRKKSTQIPYKKPLAEKSSPQMGLNHKRVRPKMMQILKVYRPFGSLILNECTI